MAFEKDAIGLRLPRSTLPPRRAPFLAAPSWRYHLVRCGHRRSFLTALVSKAGFQPPAALGRHLEFSARPAWTSPDCFCQSRRLCSPGSIPPPFTASTPTRSRSRSTPAGGSPKIVIVGLPDTAVKESRDRVTTAISQQRLPLAARSHHDQSRAGRHQKRRAELRPARSRSA